NPSATDPGEESITETIADHRWSERIGHAAFAPNLGERDRDRLPSTRSRSEIPVCYYKSRRGESGAASELEQGKAGPFNLDINYRNFCHRWRPQVVIRAVT